MPAARAAAAPAECPSHLRRNSERLARTRRWGPEPGGGPAGRGPRVPGRAARAARSPAPTLLPGPRLVFNRVNGRRPPATSPSLEVAQETYTLAHEENVRFVSKAWQQVEQQLDGSPAGESGPRAVQYTERTPDPRLQALCYPPQTLCPSTWTNGGRSSSWLESPTARSRCVGRNVAHAGPDPAPQWTLCPPEQALRCSGPCRCPPHLKCQHLDFCTCCSLGLTAPGRQG
ncbi:MAPK regulated corepressor interacting protein 2 isoform X2 [Choloepus didactylus]|uniref:MAPK regulated corepressor interacting protein 2 isoform X2 n=1 Tax=Choloepus didactylus TaxID=27675 RepID=UPI00189E4FFB|nr:MAPK regulated corepressor interacting protein 2 isoform X2 [Choloepus didactylus]